MKNESEELYSVTEIANAMGVSRITVFRYIKAKKLRAIRVGRSYKITEADVHLFQYRYLMSDEIKAQLKKIVFDMVDGIRAAEVNTILRHGIDKSDTTLED